MRQEGVSLEPVEGAQLWDPRTSEVWSPRQRQEDFYGFKPANICFLGKKYRDKGCAFSESQ